MRRRKYRYLISYVSSDDSNGIGNGSVIVKRDRKILTAKHHSDVRTAILANNPHFYEVVIVNHVLME